MPTEPPPKTLRPSANLEVALHVLAAGDVAVYSSADPTAEGRANEDRASVTVIDSGTTVLSVADGAGGHQDGGAAAERALEALTSVLTERESPTADLRSCMMDAFERANRRVLELGTGAATTLAVALIEGRTLRTYHAGDSLVLLVGGRGRIRLQTVAHSPVGYALEAGILEPSEAMHHDDRHVVSNMVGTVDMHFEARAPRKLRPRDTLVIASDGLSDNLYVEEIAELVRRGPLDQAAAALALACRQRMLAPVPGQPSKPDDLSFLLFRPRSRPLTIATE